MNVFLTGATGYIGSAAAQALREAGHQVTGLARSDEAAQKLQERGLSARRGDLSDSDSLAAGARAADAVIHTASANDATSPRTDPPAITAMLDAVAGTDKPFIYTGGTWEVGDTGGQVVDETFVGQPAALVAWRPAVTQRVLDAAWRGVQSVVIRPGLVYGHGGGMMAMLIQEARRDGVVRYIGTGENHWTMVHVDDLADLYVRALGAPAGTLLFGAAGDPVQARDAAEAASLGGGAGGRTQSWPLEEARQVLGPLADALVLDQQVSGARAQRLLGWNPQSPSVLDDLAHGSYAALPEA
ncbi:MAG: NAD-dependent epimerase/dehydratase family protein [Armatimonadetes bacterium]|nr:NAD-dependent epimerase/dehydratase family protein [Armatimonadota bacterium]